MITSQKRQLLIIGHSADKNFFNRFLYTEVAFIKEKEEYSRQTKMRNRVKETKVWLCKAVIRNPFSTSQKLETFSFMCLVQGISHFCEMQIVQLLCVLFYSIITGTCMVIKQCSYQLFPNWAFFVHCKYSQKS